MNGLLFPVDCEHADDHVPEYAHAVEWSTPQSIYAPLHDEFGFTLDVCASHGNAKCSRYFTANDDGLMQAWAGERVWMNPPYARGVIDRWMQRAAEEVEREGGASLVVCLVPASTSTAWWHDYALRGEVRFVRGRIRFGGAKNSAMFANAIVIFTRQLTTRSKLEFVCD